MTMPQIKEPTEAAAASQEKAAKKGSPTPPKPPASDTQAQPAKKTRTEPARLPKKKAGARRGSKTAKVLELLKRPNGVTLRELIKATGWQPHSVRGFLSGAIAKKQGLKVKSTKNKEGERNYRVEN